MYSKHFIPRYCICIISTASNFHESVTYLGQLFLPGPKHMYAALKHAFITTRMKQVLIETEIKLKKH